MAASIPSVASNLGHSATSLYASIVVVTPNDAADLTDGATKGIYVGGAGNLRVITANGETVTITAVPVGSILPIVVTRVLSTSTTATNILALY